MRWFITQVFVSKTQNRMLKIVSHVSRLLTYWLPAVTLIDFKVKSESMQQQPCYFCYAHISDSGLTSCENIISSHKTSIECNNMECFASSMKPTCYTLPATNIFQTASNVGFEVIHFKFIRSSRVHSALNILYFDKN